MSWGTSLWIARGLAVVGFLDAAYLTASYFAGSALACGPGGGCELVTTSPYATLGPVPIAAIGLGYYALVSLIVWTPAGGLSRGLLGSLFLLTGTAVAVSTVLFYLQAVVIGAWCRFCLVSAGVTVLLFLTALVLARAARPAGEAPTGP
ncbi:MAG: vitamin K epoxide reductase family protein [Gemmatimonadota bacterium]